MIILMGGGGEIETMKDIVCYYDMDGVVSFMIILC